MFVTHRRFICFIVKANKFSKVRLVFDISPVSYWYCITLDFCIFLISHEAFALKWKCEDVYRYILSNKKKKYELCSLYLNSRLRTKSLHAHNPGSTWKSILKIWSLSTCTDEDGSRLRCILTLPYSDKAWDQFG